MNSTVLMKMVMGMEMRIPILGRIMGRAVRVPIHPYLEIADAKQCPETTALDIFNAPDALATSCGPVTCLSLVFP